MFLREYTSGRNYAFSDTNNLISNLKKKPNVSQAQLNYKNGAIARSAAELRASLNPKWLDVAMASANSAASDSMAALPQAQGDNPAWQQHLDTVTRMRTDGLSWDRIGQFYGDQVAKLKAAGFSQARINHYYKERAPPFDGESATFEAERVREPGCPWSQWRVLRRV